MTNAVRPWTERHEIALRRLWPQHTCIADAIAAFRRIIRRPAADVLRQAVALGLATEAEARAIYPWSPLQDAALVALVLQGFAFEVIAEKMDRPRASVAGQLDALRRRGWTQVLRHLRSHPDAGTRTGAQIGRPRFAPWPQATAGEKAYLRLRVPMAENFDQAVGWAMKRLRRPEAQVRWLIASISTDWGNAVHIDGIDRHLWPAGWDARMVTAFTSGKSADEVARWLHRGSDEIALRWHLLRENPRRLQVVRGLLGELPPHLPAEAPTESPQKADHRPTRMARSWTLSETKDLRRALVAGYSSEVVALMSGRSADEVRHQMHSLKISDRWFEQPTGHGGSWSSEERLIMLRALQRHAPVAVIAKALGRTTNALGFELRRMGASASSLQRMRDGDQAAADLRHLVARVLRALR